MQWSFDECHLSPKALSPASARAEITAYSSDVGCWSLRPLCRAIGEIYTSELLLSSRNDLDLVALAVVDHLPALSELRSEHRDSRIEDVLDDRVCLARMGSHHAANSLPDA